MMNVQIIRGKNNIQQFEAISEINDIISKDLDSRVNIAKDLLRIELPAVITPIFRYNGKAGMLYSAVDVTDNILEKIDLNVYTGEATSMLRLIIKGMIRRIGNDILDNISYKHMISTVNSNELEDILDGDKLNSLLNNICVLLK